MKKLNNLFIYLFIIVFSFIGLIYLGSSSLLLTLLTLGVFIYLIYKKDIPKFGWLLFITSFLIRLALILFFVTEQTSDFKTLLEASYMLKDGNFSFNLNPYFQMWGYQTGFVIYQALILKLFNSVFILKLLNAIYSSTLVLLVYLFGRKLTDEKSARFASLLYMIFLLPLILNTILTNQHLQALLIYIGIFFILKDNAFIKEYIIAGILISLGNIIRPEGIIVVTSLIIYLFLLLRKDNFKNIIIKFVSFIIPYILVGIIASNLVVMTNINPSGLSNKDPLWKFVLGFNHDTCGVYTDADTIYLGDKEKELEIIKDRLSNPYSLVTLTICKTKTQWLLDDMSWDNNTLDKIHILGLELDYKTLENIAVSYNHNINLICIMLCLFGIFYYRKDEKIDKAKFFIIMALVTFGVYTLIEIQPRYAYFIEITLFILSNYGISAITDICKKYIKRNKH